MILTMICNRLFTLESKLRKNQIMIEKSSQAMGAWSIIMLGPLTKVSFLLLLLCKQA
jgi:hypothetical protein